MSKTKLCVVHAECFMQNVAGQLDSFTVRFYVRVVSPVDISLGPDSRRLSAVPSSLPTPLSTCLLLPVLPGHYSRGYSRWSRSRRTVSSRVSAYRHSTIFLLLLLLCGDVEPNPGPPQTTCVKCICLSTSEEGSCWNMRSAAAGPVVSV